MVLDKVVGWCFSILLAAMALHGAVLLIRCVWPWLVAALAVIGIVVLITWLIMRWRGF